MPALPKYTATSVTRCLKAEAGAYQELTTAYAKPPAELQRVAALHQAVFAEARPAECVGVGRWGAAGAAPGGAPHSLGTRSHSGAVVSLHVSLCTKHQAPASAGLQLSSS